jgi:hypothetical protein
MPLFAVLQLAPSSVERYTPYPCLLKVPVILTVPAKIFEPLTVNELIPAVAGRPVVTPVQLIPLFVLRNNPLSVPIKIVDPLTARAQIGMRTAVFAQFQLAPWSVDRKRPLIVPASRSFPQTANAVTYCGAMRGGNPEFTEVHEVPLFVVT